MKHRHAELMMEYARDAMETDKPWERWEFKFEGDEWKDLVDHAIWRIDCEYRRKPKTININGHEVPEPVREPLKMQEIYYAAYLFSRDEPVSTIWSGASFDTYCLENGLVHVSKEAAIKHTEALLSFTRIEK